MGNKRIGNIRLNAPEFKPELGVNVKQFDLLGVILGPPRFSFAEKPHKGRGSNPDVAYVDYECDVLLPTGKPSGFTVSAAIWEKHEEVIQAGVKGVYKYEDPSFFSAKCWHADTDIATDAKERWKEYVGEQYAVWKNTPEGKGEVKTSSSRKSRPAGRLVSEFVPASQYS
jgi:hypothetical protein